MTIQTTVQVPPGSGRGERPRVVLADDRVADRAVVADTLGHHGFTVTETSTAERVLQLVASSPTDAVVLDLRLPDRSGFDVLRELQSRPHLVVVAVGESSDESDCVTALELGADTVERPRHALKLLLDAHRARLEPRDVATHRTEALGEQVHDDLEVLDPRETVGADVGGEGAGALRGVDREGVEFGDAGIRAGALVRVEGALDGRLDPGRQHRPQVGGDLLDLFELGRNVAVVVLLAHAAASVAANEGWPEPGSG